MDELTCLDANAILPDRPFAHPDHSLTDLAMLSRSVAALSALLADGAGAASGATLMRVEFFDNQHLHQRVILNRRFDLRQLPFMELVGFFGQRCQEADRAALAAVDEELLIELHDHVDILCYFTSQLVCGDYGNLVLFRTAAAKEHWMESQRHAWAVRQLAPRCYHTIRLHNGFISGGLSPKADLRLTCTKYYDYDQGWTDGRPWRSVRLYQPPLTLSTEE